MVLNQHILHVFVQLESCVNIICHALLFLVPAEFMLGVTEHQPPFCGKPVDLTGWKRLIGRLAAKILQEKKKLEEKEILWGMKCFVAYP